MSAMPESKPIRILYMEDDPGSADLFRKTLREHGYEVEVAADGEQGLAMLQQGHFDVVAVDQNIPVHEGLEVIRILADQGNQPPTIMITGAGDERVAADAIKLGASEYVVKDMDGGYLELLPTVLEQVLHKQRLRQQKTVVEAALQDRERLFRTLVETATDIIWTVDMNLRNTYVSPAATRLLGYEVSELMGASPLDLLTDESRKRVLAAFAEEMEREAAGRRERTRSRTEEIEQYHKDGSIRSFEITTTFLRDESGQATGILGISRDITDRKLAREALRESEARYRTLVEKSPVGIISCDLQGNITELNPSAGEILGAPLDKASISHTISDYEALTESRISNAIVKYMESNAPVVGEFPLKSVNRGIIYARVHVVPTRDSDGSVSGAQVTIEDISDQKRAEGLRLRSERYKAVFDMARGITRNFDNALRGVAANAQMALSCLDSRDYSEVRDLLESIGESARQAVQTVRRVQQFAKARSPVDVSPRKVFDLTAAVQYAVENRELWYDPRLEKKGIDVSVDAVLAKNCPVQGEEDEIIEVVSNVLRNAVEALPSGGTIRVKTFSEQGHVVLKVRDDGIGIPKKSLEKIFEPFWTTRENHGGMGLAVSLGILRRHLGTIRVTSRPRRGTTITIRLPKAGKPADKLEAPTATFSDLNFRILIMDDDEPHLRSLDQGLKRLGHSTFAALSAHQGLRTFQESEFDAVICHLSRPGADSWEVGRQIQEICLEKGVPKPPFIMLTSELTDPQEGGKLVRPGVDRVVREHASATELLDIVGKEVQGAVSQAAFAGSIYGIDMLEYVQLLMFTGQKTVLEIRSRDGSKGFLYVDKGEIRHAACGDLDGEEALYRCLSFKGGSFTSLPWREPERTTINKPGEFLLFEAARRRDEMLPDGEDKP